MYMEILIIIITLVLIFKGSSQLFKRPTINTYLAKDYQLMDATLLAIEPMMVLDTEYSPPQSHPGFEATFRVYPAIDKKPYRATVQRIVPPGKEFPKVGCTMKIYVHKQFRQVVFIPLSDDELPPS